MSQYALHLSLSPVFSEDNFVVSGCNRDAWRWVTSWPDWPAHALYVAGPEGCGNSHLGHIWAKKAGAQVMPAHALLAQDTAGMTGNWLIEDIDAATNERSLLHLFNFSREQGNSLLLTSRLSAQQLPFTLPDLTSRLLSLPAAAIDEADDEALAATLRKQFADRQLKVDDDIIAYLLPRIDRSFSKINELIRSLDQAALAEQKRLTIPFVRHILSLPLA